VITIEDTSSGMLRELKRQIFRTHWCQVEKDEVSPPEKATLKIPQPQMSKTYYDICGAIDQHNRQRQA
jgi:hypothetical protein